MSQIACFSKDGLTFAYQADRSKKNTIDLYPLDPENNYMINSSLVNNIDCESNDLKISELNFYGWCYNEIANGSTKTKRRNSDDAGVISTTSHENYFVNVYGTSKIVVYTQTGKDIVNILKSKDSIIGMATDGPFIWVLDENMVAKKFHYNQSKQQKSFTFSEGRDSNVKNFEVLYRDEKTFYIVIFTEDKVYLIDPSKRRAVTKLVLEIGYYSHAEFLNNGEYLVLSNSENLLVVDFDSGKEVFRWETEAAFKFKVIKDFVFVLTGNDNSIDVFKFGEKQPTRKIVASSSTIIDFEHTSGDNLLVAWLNVNEPNFKKLSLGDINSAGSIIDVNTSQHDGTDLSEDNISVAGNEDSSEKEITQRQKITKAGQDKISQELLTALIEGEDKEIIEILNLPTWSSDRISNFLNNKIEENDQAVRLYQLVADEIEKDPWSDNATLPVWLKWILLIKGKDMNISNDKKTRKQTRHLKSALRTSSTTLPILLCIQGRLEMLKTQAKLRKELAGIQLEQDDSTTTENNITYADGESDSFVDAAEYVEAKQ